MRAAETFITCFMTDRGQVLQEKCGLHDMITPPCRCIIDGLRQMSTDQKVLMIHCHSYVSDHLPLLKCRHCGLYAMPKWLKVHQYFNCDDEEARRVAFESATLDIFRYLYKEKIELD